MARETMFQKLVYSSVWLAIASICGRAGVLLASLLVVRWWGQEAYGQVALLQSTVLMTGGVIGSGFGMAAAKLIAEYRNASPRKAGAAILLFEFSTVISSTLAGTALFLGRDILAVDLLNEPMLVDLLGPGVILLVLTSWNLFQAGILSGLEVFRGSATVNALSGIIAMPIIVVGVWLDGAKGAVWAQVVSTGISCVIHHISITSACRAARIEHSWQDAIAQRGLIWRFGIPAAMLSSIHAPTDWISLALLTRSLNGIDEVGIYSAANQWCLLLRFLPMMMGAALLPIATQAISTGSAVECRRIIGVGLLASVLLSAPLALLVACASPIILSWYGAAMVDYWPILAILSAASFFIAIQTTIDRFLMSLSATWSSFYLSVARSFVQIALLVMLIDRGASGLAVARLASFVVGAIASLGLIFIIVARQDAARSESGTPFQDLSFAEIPLKLDAA
jgi:O-antigen/teichoic acid export membrane protein